MKNDPFEAYERLPESYHKDPRWKEVVRLHSTGIPGDVARSNGLVLEIRRSYGFDG